VADEEIVVVNVRAETKEEKKLRKWLGQQRLGSVDNLEAAARQIIGLVTGLIGVLFTVLTLASDKPPAYLQRTDIRVIGAVSVGALLVALLAALVVVLPRPWTFSPSKPASESQAFEAILDRKKQWLQTAVILFCFGVFALGAALVMALLNP
jgi:hypothetical protein